MGFLEQAKQSPYYKEPEYTNEAQKEWYEQHYSYMDSIFNDEKSILEFMKYGAQLYKYDLATILFAYGQDPDATFLADFDTWKKVERVPKRGTTSIRVPKVVNGSLKQNYLFDVKQTVGKEYAFPNWNYEIEHFKQILQEMQFQDSEKNFNAAFDSLDEQLLSVVVLSNDDLKETNLDEAIVVQSSKFMILNKLGFRPNTDLLEKQLGSYVKTTNYLGVMKHVLELNQIVLGKIREADKIVKNKNLLEAKKVNETKLHLQHKREWSIKSNHSKQYRTPTAREIRENGFRVVRNSKSRGVFTVANWKSADELRKLPGERSVGTSQPLGERIVGERASIEHNELDGKNKAFKQNQDDSGGTSNQSTISLTNKKKSETKEVNQVELTDIDQLDLFQYEETVIDADLVVKEENEDIKIVKQEEIRNEKNLVTVENSRENKPKISDFSFPEGEFYSSSIRGKIKDNIAAIKLVKSLELEGTQASKEEQRILAKYVGWGGLSVVFDKREVDFEEEYKELKSLLSESDYESARESVLTAYYTDPMIIDQMYKTVERFGFEGGKILDPGMGTGNFYSSIPESLKNKSDLFGVEKDLLTGKIASHLHPNADIQIKGFEETSFEENSFDLVIGNVPFDDFTIDIDVEETAGGKNSTKKYRIHDYFIQKSINLVREGGIIAVISSRGTLDSGGLEKTRFAQKVDLLGAVRLPNNAFKKIAGTNVVADILLFKKLPKSVKRETDPTWVKPQKVSFDDRLIQGEIPVVAYNNYFIDNPQQILGDLEPQLYRGWSLTVKPFKDKDLSALLETGLGNIEGTYEKRKQKVVEAVEEGTKDTQGLKEPLIKKNEGDLKEPSRNFAYFERDGVLYFHENKQLTKVDVSDSLKKRIIGLVKVREALDDVIEIQRNFGYSEERFQELLTIFGNQYDTFVKKFGWINTSQNEKAFREDDTLPLLLSIENKEKDGSYTKADIFKKATIRPIKQINRTETALEALYLSMSRKAVVDLDYIQSLYPKPLETILSELDKEIVINPVKFTGKLDADCWEINDEYLTGDVKTKLEEAKFQVENYPELFTKNVEALKKVIPTDLKSSEIDYKIGATWIPVEYYKEFMYSTFDTRGFNQNETSGITIEFNEYNGVWFIQNKNKELSSVIATSKYGSKRASAYKILEDSLNLKKSEVRDQEHYINSSGNDAIRHKLNVKETMIAREKQDEIEEAFKNWLFSDRTRTVELMHIYNEKFNRTRPRVYDGSRLEFDEMNPDFELRDHQKNVVARILYSGRALMAHEVGAGKTASMLAAGMLLKQNNLIKKPLYVVPNHLTNQFAQELLRFYPSKNVLVTTKQDFAMQNRKKFVSKIATGSYDAVIIGHSQFYKISMSQEYQTQKIKKELEDISFSIERMKNEKGERWTLKKMISFEKKLKEKLSSLNSTKNKDSLLTFEQLGVDFLFVDEAHTYKNLHTYTKLQNVSGVNTSHSQRASDMHMKCQYMLEQNNRNGVVFATGTPVSNSMSEMYTMQRFLQPDILEKQGLSAFDAWASTFGVIESSLEITPAGDSYQMKNRFAKFHNLPELMSTFNLVADIQTADMLKLPVPEVKGGKAQIIVTEASDYQLEMMQELADRSEAVRNRQVEPYEDNMLKITHEAKLMAIDPRLIDEAAPNEPFSKLGRCCDKVFTIWLESKNNKSTQMIFSDSGTPKPSFNVYDEIKRQLIGKGIPSHEIAFIHDAKNDKQKDIMFEKMRKGDIRVLLGSTSKVGTGTNVQDKLLAVHHVDVPWRPSDITQRDGRIIRQGNENKEVQVYRYVTKSTFDSYLWQIQEQKLRYISQIMTGKSISRSCDDLDETVLNAADVKAIATGNPLLAEKMVLDNEITRLQLIKSRWADDKLRLQERVEKVIPSQIHDERILIDKISKDSTLLSMDTSEEFKIVIGGLEYSKRADAAKHLDLLCKRVRTIDAEELDVGEFKGFKLAVSPAVYTDGYRLTATAESTYEATIYTGTEIGSIRKIENLIERIPGKVDELKQSIDGLEKQLIDTEQQLKEPFKNEEKLLGLLIKQRELDLKMEAGVSHKTDDVQEITTKEGKQPVVQIDLSGANQKFGSDYEYGRER